MVTDLAKPESNYQSAFRALKQSKPTVAWVEIVRESAMDRFESLGFPTVANEEWKYTNLAGLAKDSFRPSESTSAITAADLRRFSFPETANSQVVVVNGQFRQDLSSTAELESIVAVDLFSAIADARYNKIVRSYLARNANYHDKSMTALNTAFLQSGVFILIPKDTKLEAPVQISFVVDPSEPNIAV